MMITRTLLGSALVLGVGGALVPFALPAHAATTVEVDYSNFSFSPSVVHISVGDSVHWVNKGGFHSVTDAGGAFNHGPNASPDDFTATYNTAGTFPYFCSVHQSQGMVGTVVVDAAAPAPALAESSLAVGLPLVGLAAVGGAAYFVRRRRAA